MSRILITGSTGFLGKTILENKVDEFITLGRNKTDDISWDMSGDLVPIVPQVEFCFHVAGKAHVVPRTESEKEAFYNINVRATKNLLKGLEQCDTLQGFVFISSVAVYGLEVGEKIGEDSLLNAIDPYGKSKIEAEKIIQEWCDYRKVSCLILRLPLIAGENPPGNLGAMIGAIRKGYYFNIAGGKAERSVVLDSDVATFMNKHKADSGIYNLVGSQDYSYNEISQFFKEKLQEGRVLNMPLFLAKLLAFVGDVVGKLLKKNLPFNKRQLLKMTSSLTFSGEKVKRKLAWEASEVFNINNKL